MNHDTFRGPDGREYQVIKMNGARVLRACSPAYPSKCDRPDRANQQAAPKVYAHRSVGSLNAELQRIGARTALAEGERITLPPLSGPERRLARAVFYLPKGFKR